LDYWNPSIEAAQRITTITTTSSNKRRGKEGKGIYASGVDAPVRGQRWSRERRGHDRNAGDTTAAPRTAAVAGDLLLLVQPWQWGRAARRLGCAAWRWGRDGGGGKGPTWALKRGGAEVQGTAA